MSSRTRLSSPVVDGMPTLFGASHEFRPCDGRDLIRSRSLKLYVMSVFMSPAFSFPPPPVRPGCIDFTISNATGKLSIIGAPHDIITSSVALPGTPSANYFRQV